jgi:hypothetical protein
MPDSPFSNRKVFTSRYNTIESSDADAELNIVYNIVYTVIPIGD